MRQFIDYILDHQSADGWLGPNDDTDGNCYWSKFPLLMALRQVSATISTAFIMDAYITTVQYYEANSSDTRVIPAMMRFLNATHKKMFATPLGNSW